MKPGRRGHAASLFSSPRRRAADREEKRQAPDPVYLDCPCGPHVRVNRDLFDPQCLSGYCRFCEKTTVFRNCGGVWMAIADPRPLRKALRNVVILCVVIAVLVYLLFVTNLIDHFSF